MGISPPDLDYDPHGIPHEYMEAIGLVAACSAQTESVIELAISGCLGLETQYGTAVTAHMSGPQRKNLLLASAELRLDDLDALDELDLILENIETVMQKRNSAVHNQWGYSPKQKKVYTARFSARGSVRGDLIPMDLNTIKSDAWDIYEAGLRLMNFIRVMGLIPKIGPSEPRHHRLKSSRKKRVKD